MSELTDALAAGDVAAILRVAQERVRAQPAEATPRVALSQVLMILGQWERAMTQLAVLEEMDAALLPYVRTYQTAIQCERLREEIFLGRRTPLVLGEPVPWLAKLQQSNHLLAERQLAAAADLRAEALEEAPARGGVLNQEPFEWIADQDSRLGPVFELIIDGKYYWVPAERLQRLVVHAPADIRDLVWLPAEITLVNGGQKVALIPARYPGSERSENGAIMLNRRSEWLSPDEDTYTGLGQRLLVTDRSECALLELRELEFREEL